MRAGLIQLNGSDDPAENIAQTLELIERAIGAGAEFVLTPEVTNCVSLDRKHQHEVLRNQDADPTLKAMQNVAATNDIWVLVGSLALKTDDPNERFANRSFLIDPSGSISARYDKIHMFDVAVSEAETYLESAGYRAGDRAVLADMPFGRLGMTICYDLRFPALFRDLAQAGAGVITVPSAFSPVTGVAHWETLLRARAIECGAYILAPAQCGTHKAQTGKQRQTYGHSLAVDPWGRVLVDGGGELQAVTLVDIDMAEVTSARRRIPALQHDRSFTRPHEHD